MRRVMMVTLAMLLLSAATPHCWDVAAGASEGGPDYSTIAGPTVELLAVVLPPMVIIEGEVVPVTLDLPWFLCIHSYEASGWHNHIDGGLQIIPPTWKSQGGHEYAPHAGDATVIEQIDIGRNVLTSGGVRQWSTWRMCP